MEAKLGIRDFFQHRAVKTALCLFVVLTIWRIIIIFLPSVEGEFNALSFAWGACYQIVAIWGSVWGLKAAKSWGGTKSLLGRVIITFSIGLLLQAFGQTVYSYYIFTTGAAPYPSIGDIGFFGSIPFYLYGVILLARLSDVTISFRSFLKSAFAIIIPVAMVTVSYYLFLSGYEYNLNNPINVFLDFGYPLGQAFYVAVAILALLVIFTKNILGGILRGSIILFLLALVMQYISDFTFLYQASRNIYIPEGINDYMYLLSYLLMALSLVRLGIAFEKVKNTA